MCFLFFYFFFPLLSHLFLFLSPAFIFFFTPTTSSRRVSNTTPEHTEISQLFILLKMVHTFCLNRSILVNIETIEDTVPPIVSFPPLLSLLKGVDRPITLPKPSGTTHLPDDGAWVPW